MNKLKREYQFFKQQTSNVRVLLMTNLLYALVLPVVEIFVGAYVMRHTSEPVSVAFHVHWHHHYLICEWFLVATCECEDAVCRRDIS